MSGLTRRAAPLVVGLTCPIDVGRDAQHQGDGHAP